MNKHKYYEQEQHHLNELSTCVKIQNTDLKSKKTVKELENKYKNISSNISDMNDSYGGMRRKLEGYKKSQKSNIN